MGRVPQNSGLSTTLFCILMAQMSNDNMFVKLNFHLDPIFALFFQICHLKFNRYRKTG